MRGKITKKRLSLLAIDCYAQLHAKSSPERGDPFPASLSLGFVVANSFDEELRRFFERRGIAFGGAAHHTQCSCTEKWKGGEQAGKWAIFCFTTLQQDVHCFPASRADCSLKRSLVGIDDQGWEGVTR